MNLHRKPIREARIKAVERFDRRTGVEVAPEAQSPAKANVERFQWVKAILRGGILLLAGWRPTDLGLWQRRTKLPIGYMTETYNFKTACREQFGPGGTKPNLQG